MYHPFRFGSSFCFASLRFDLIRFDSLLGCDFKSGSSREKKKMMMMMKFFQFQKLKLGALKQTATTPMTNLFQPPV